MTHHPMLKDRLLVVPISAKTAQTPRSRRVGRAGWSFAAALTAFSVAGCATSKPDLPIDDLCSQMRKSEYIFRPIGNTPMGSLEPGIPVDQGALVIDDDDLSDDYGGWKSNPEYGWLKALDTYQVWADANPTELALVNNIAEGVTLDELSDAENDAVVEVTEVYLEIASIHCASIELYLYEIGEMVAPPTFVECKDRYYANGDGVIGFVDLTETVLEEPVAEVSGSAEDTLRRSSTYFALQEQDRMMAQCPAPETVYLSDDQGAPILDLAGQPIINDDLLAQRANTQAVNFWAPLTTSVTSIAGASSARDGQTFSGATVPISVALYKRSFDASQWDGVGLWARLVDADQGIPSDRISPAGEEPLSGRKRPADAKAQTGKNTLAFIIQTVDTAALNEDGSVQFRPTDECKPAENGAAPVAAEMAVPCFADRAAFDALDTPLQQDLDDDGNVVGEFKWGVYGANGLPLPAPFPFCVDYSPADAPVEGEVPFRDQCWDGFRSVREISAEWKFYFFPFEDMRQSGSGRIAESFARDRIKSMNVFASVFQPVNVLIDEISFYKSR